MINIAPKKFIVQIESSYSIITFKGLGFLINNAYCEAKKIPNSGSGIGVQTEFSLNTEHTEDLDLKVSTESGENMRALVEISFYDIVIVPQMTPLVIEQQSI